MGRVAAGETILVTRPIPTATMNATTLNAVMTTAVAEGPTTPASTGSRQCSAAWQTTGTWPSQAVRRNTTSSRSDLPCLMAMFILATGWEQVTFTLRANGGGLLVLRFRSPSGTKENLTMLTMRTACP